MNAPLVRPLVVHRPGDNELSRRLQAAVQGEVRFDRATRGRYSTDASIYQIEPIGVLIPKVHDDVRAAMDICRELGVPVLPRGGGSSQCGQTVGAALVIDHSKYLNGVVGFDRDAMTVTVEPGIVLDALNAWLRPHGVWFPVDVSTSAQATLGGMAGNNSCGSRSIAYGNMVHNVVAAEALFADGTEGWLGAEREMQGASARIRELMAGLRAIAERERDEIANRVPKVMRRVGGYNLDVFHPQSERPVHAGRQRQLRPPAGRIRGHAGLDAHADPEARTAAAAPHAGRGQLPDAVQGDGADEAHRDARPVGGGAGRSHDDRTGAQQPVVPPDHRRCAGRRSRCDPAGGVHAATSAGSSVARLDDLVALMGDLGLPGQVVRMTDASAQKALWEVRKAGLNIMMSMKGDGKPVSFIEDCAVPLEHLADYVDRLTQVFAKHGTRGTWYAHASVGTLHVRPILDMRQGGPNGGAAKMRAIAEEASAMVREYKGAYSGEHGDGLVRTEWVAWQFGARLTRAFEEVKRLFDPDGLMNPGKIVRGTKMDDARLFRYPPGYQPLKLATALDWSAWNVNAGPCRRHVDGTRHRRRSGTGLRQGRRDVQQQRSLPQVRCRDDVPELPCDARRRARHARPRQHAAARAVRPARSRVRQRRRTRST